MTTFQIEIDEQLPLGKSLVAYLQSIPQIATLRKVEKEEIISMDELYGNLDSAFRDVKLMVDGKKRKKSLQELIDEL